MLAAVARPGIRHDHARLLFRDAERLRQFAAHAKRPLRAGPYRDLVAFPLRPRGAGLQTNVRDVSDGEGRQVGVRRGAALAEWAGDKVTVWTGSQRPFGVRSELAQAFGIPEEKARVIVPDTGSGYG